MPSRKTTAKQEQEISQAYLRGTPTRMLCEKYSLSGTCIRDILRRNGVVPSGGPKPLTSDQKAQIYRFYQAGHTTREIAELAGVVNGTVSKVLRAEFGVTKRPSTKRKKLSSDQRKELAERYKRGETYHDLMAAYNVSGSTVKSALVEHGVRPRKGWLKYRTVRWTDRKGRSWVFKSTWEQKYAQYLDSHSVDWDYEPVSFPLQERQCYTPDFEIQVGDDLYYVEVHGWLDDLTRQRIREFCELYPDVKYDLLGPAEMAELGLADDYYSAHPEGKKMTRARERFRSMEPVLLS